jgi:hypothetical protein
MTFWKQVESPDGFTAQYGDVAASAMKSGTLAHLFRAELASNRNQYRESQPNEKPQGMYFSIVADERTSGGIAYSGTQPRFERRARLTVRLDDPTVLHVRQATLREADGSTLELCAGLSALKHLNPALFDEALPMVHEAAHCLAALMNDIYPAVALDQTLSPQELLMAAGGIEARQRGYKAMLGTPLPWSGVPEAELVALTNDAITWVEGPGVSAERHHQPKARRLT